MSGRTGVLGGAFNPPHIAHLVLAAEALSGLGLDRVVFVPTGIAPHKEIEDDPGAEARLALVRRAVEGCEGFEVSDLEIGDSEPSYTFRTLERLDDQLPETELTFLIGADAAAALESWRRPERIVELARIGVAARAGSEGKEAAVLERLGARVDRVGMPPLEISSTLIRERVRAGKSIRWLVSPGVEEMIAERGLYGGGDE